MQYPTVIATLRKNPQPVTGSTETYGWINMDNKSYDALIPITLRLMGYFETCLLDPWGRVVFAQELETNFGTSMPWISQNNRLSAEFEAVKNLDAETSKFTFGGAEYKKQKSEGPYWVGRSIKREGHGDRLIFVGKVWAGKLSQQCQNAPCYFITASFVNSATLENCGSALALEFAKTHLAMEPSQNFRASTTTIWDDMTTLCTALEGQFDTE